MITRYFLLYEIFGHLFFYQFTYKYNSIVKVKIE